MATSRRAPRASGSPTRDRSSGVTIPYPSTDASRLSLRRRARPGRVWLSSALAIWVRRTRSALRSWVMRCSVSMSMRRRSPSLSAGEVPFHEPGLDELLRKNLAAGRLRFTTSYEEVAAFGDVHFICVGTPQRADSLAADLSLCGDGRVTAGSASDPQGTDRRQVHRAGRHRRVDRAVGTSSRPGRAGRRGRLDPGVPPGRLRRRRRPAPQPGHLRREVDWANGMLYACPQGRVRSGRDRGPGGPGRGHRLRHRRVGQGRRERVPGHEDLVHQRDGRGV